MKNVMKIFNTLILILVGLIAISCNNDPPVRPVREKEIIADVSGAFNMHLETEITPSITTLSDKRVFSWAGMQKFNDTTFYLTVSICLKLSDTLPTVGDYKCYPTILKDSNAFATMNFSYGDLSSDKQFRADTGTVSITEITPKLAVKGSYICKASDPSGKKSVYINGILGKKTVYY
jgi:hypothetical protein